MSTDLTFREFQAACKRRSATLTEYRNFRQLMLLSQWSNALAGETGEVCNLIKKIERGDFQDDPEKACVMLGEELGDVIAYAVLLSEHAGLDLGEVTARKFNIKSDQFGVPEHKI